jgi:GTP cyclohydrolase II
MRAENHLFELTPVASCALPTRWGEFRLSGFADGAGQEVLLLAFGEAGFENVLVRVHSECLTGDAFFSQRCDCGAQLEAAFRKIALAGAGLIVYLRQEGRGIGLLNKIRAYALQDSGLDTVEANEALGFAADARHYALAAVVLRQQGVRSVRLMTNNPSKIKELEEAGIRVAACVPHVFGVCGSNRSYLATKRDRFGHLL